MSSTQSLSLPFFLSFSFQEGHERDSDGKIAMKFYNLCREYAHFKDLFIKISKRNLTCILNKEVMKEMDKYLNNK